MRKESNTMKVLKGTMRPSRDGSIVPISNLVKIPTAPKFLNKDGRKYYRTICKHLMESKSLFSIDAYIVAMAANSILLYHEMMVELSDPEAYYQVFKTGAKNVSVEYTIMRDAEKNIKDYSKMLGLDISSRDKIRAFVEKIKDQDSKKGLRKKLKHGTGD